MSPGDQTRKLIGHAPTQASGPPRERLNVLERTATMSMALGSAGAGAVPPAAPTQSFAEGVQVAGRYRIVRFVARGGMGEVYEAHDLVLGERVALKSIRQGAANEKAVERFRREVQLARRVTHPNVCRIFDVGVHEGVSFLSMEFLAGQTLSERLDRQGPMAVAAARPIAQQLAAGLQAAHHEGIVHRDLKSANVMLVPSPGRAERVVITDFGLARLAVTDEEADGPHDLTTGAGIAGSPAYMSPEQVVGGPITPAADVYALGVVLFEVVTGKLPFIADTPLATAVKRLHEPPPSPRWFAPDLDEGWEAAIKRCLAREPADRFADAAAVAAALGDAEPGSGERAPAPWSRRRRAALITGIALGLTVGVGLPIVLSRVRHKPAASASDERGARRLRILDLAVQKTGEGRYQLDRPLYEQWLDDPDEHGKAGRLVRTVIDERNVGFKLYALQQGTLLERLGFENGDTLRSIAGVDLVDRDAFAAAREASRDKPRVMVTFTRRAIPQAIELNLVDPEQ